LLGVRNLAWSISLLARPNREVVACQFAFFFNVFWVYI